MMSKRPGDIVESMQWWRDETAYGLRLEMTLNPEAHREPCRVYWGTHGCERPRGHDGDHWCSCCDCVNHPDPDSGCVAGPPYYGLVDQGTRFFGEDLHAVIYRVGMTCGHTAVLASAPVPVRWWCPTCKSAVDVAADDVSEDAAAGTGEKPPAAAVPTLPMYADDEQVVEVAQATEGTGS